MARPEFVAREPKDLTLREGAHVALIAVVAALIAGGVLIAFAACLPREW